MRRYHSHLWPTYPMWVVLTTAALAFEMLLPHQQLMKARMLFDFRTGSGWATFVSHQWAAFAMPDPKIMQFRVLQWALSGMFHMFLSIRWCVDGIVILRHFLNKRREHFRRMKIGY